MSQAQDRGQMAMSSKISEHGDPICAGNRDLICTRNFLRNVQGEGVNWGTLRNPREDWGTLGNNRED